MACFRMDATVIVTWRIQYQWYCLHASSCQIAWLCRGRCVVYCELCGLVLKKWVDWVTGKSNIISYSSSTTWLRMQSVFLWFHLEYMYVSTTNHASNSSFMYFSFGRWMSTLPCVTVKVKTMKEDKSDFMYVWHLARCFFFLVKTYLNLLYIMVDSSLDNTMIETL